MMKQGKRILSALLPHALLLLSLLLLTLFVTDRFNRAMAFINNEITRYGVLIWGLLLLCSVFVFSSLNRGSRVIRLSSLLGIPGGIGGMLLWVLDRIDRSAGYFNRELPKFLLAGFCVFAAALSVILIRCQRQIVFEEAGKETGEEAGKEA